MRTQVGVILLIAMSAFFVTPSRTYAVDAVAIISDPWTAVQTTVNMVGNAYTQISSLVGSHLERKEYIFDGIANVVMSAAREALVKSVIDWVNNGFQGSPAFVQNLQGYLQNVADKAVGKFIADAGLNALCSPFKVDIKAALALNYSKYQRKNGTQVGYCSFNDITKNIESLGKNTANAFTSKDLFTYAANPVNTPQGAFLDAQSKMELSIKNAQGEKTSLLNFGKGFLSKEECTEVGGKGKEEVSCKIVTPGDTISASLNKSLGIGADSLVTADEINELVSAFLGYLMSSTLKGGLTNANSSGQTGTIGYTETEQKTDLSQTRIALESIMATQQAAITGLGDVLTLIDQICYDKKPMKAGDEYNTVTIMEDPITQYKRKGIYTTYIDVLERESRAKTQYVNMQKLHTLAQTATTTQNAIAITSKVSDITQSPDTYMNSKELENLLESNIDKTWNQCAPGQRYNTGF